MNSEKRKKEILRLLAESYEPITGSEIASKFNVTRQIIVQDVALLRAEKNEIISTAKGYLLLKTSNDTIKRTITVCHGTDKIEDELKIIVDLGGHVLSTFIDHPVYGQIGEALNIKARKDIKIFMKRINETGCEPLLALTKGTHKHIIETEDEDSMDEICDALNSAGYLI